MSEITEVLYQYAQGISQRKIATRTGLSRTTVIKLVNAANTLGLRPGVFDEATLLSVSAALLEQLDNNASKKGSACAARLAVHHVKLAEWLKEPYMTIRQMNRLLSELVPPVLVSESSLHRYIKMHFPKPIQTVAVLHTQPGEQAQVDFGYAGRFTDAHTGKLQRAYAFVMTLSYSRLRFVYFVYHQDISTWIDCHVVSIQLFIARNLGSSGINGVSKLLKM